MNQILDVTSYRNKILNISGNMDSTKKADHIFEIQGLEKLQIVFLATVLFCGTPCIRYPYLRSFLKGLRWLTYFYTGENSEAPDLTVLIGAAAGGILFIIVLIIVLCCLCR